MNRGKIVETGTADEVLTNPKMEYTRTLVDAIPHLNINPILSPVLLPTGTG